MVCVCVCVCVCVRVVCSFYTWLAAFDHIKFLLWLLLSCPIKHSKRETYTCLPKEIEGATNATD